MTEAILTSGVLMGVTATALMDIWALVLKRTAGVAPPNWAMVGRWVGHLPRGTMFHDDIGAAPAIPKERVIGWLFHYAVGIIYGVVLAAVMGAEWLAAPTLWPAWAFSILMLGFGWFLLQPGLGLGWAASKAPQPWTTRGLGLLAHTVFGVGLFAGALI